MSRNYFHSLMKKDHSMTLLQLIEKLQQVLSLEKSVLFSKCLVYAGQTRNFSRFEMGAKDE